VTRTCAITALSGLPRRQAPGLDCSLRKHALTDTVPIMYLDCIVGDGPVRITEEDAERLATLVGLPISPTELPAVAVALGVLLTAARLVSEFPLPDDVEAAPTFRP
jgi:hypothetical protein